jgi:hypothetical protein
MLKMKFLKNNWGKVLFCTENFGNFASEIRRKGEMTKAPDQTTPNPSYSGGETNEGLLLRRGRRYLKQAGGGDPM